MNIADYADIINCNIQVTRYHNQGNQWCAKFEYAEVLDYVGAGMLKSEHGSGESPEEALQQYIDLIKSKIIVFNASGGDRRREFIVPDSLEL